MPIKPENKSRYPKNWKQIRNSILERAPQFRSIIPCEVLLYIEVIFWD